MLLIYRLALLFVSLTICYIAFVPHFNFTTLVPHVFLSWLGMSVEWQRTIDHLSDKLTHLIFGCVFTLLLFQAVPKLLNNHVRRNVFCVILAVALLCVGAELIQLYFVGRTFSVADIVSGFAGASLSFIIIGCRAYYLKSDTQ